MNAINKDMFSMEHCSPTCPPTSVRGQYAQSWLLHNKHVMPVATNSLADQALCQTDRLSWIPQFLTALTLWPLWQLFNAKCQGEELWFNSLKLSMFKGQWLFAFLYGLVPSAQGTLSWQELCYTTIFMVRNWGLQGHGVEEKRLCRSSKKRLCRWAMGPGTVATKEKASAKDKHPLILIHAATKGLQKSGAGTEFHKRNKDSHPSDTAWSILFHSPISSVSGLQGLLVLLFT